MPRLMAQSEETRPPVVLVIRDGWGRNPNPDQDECNAIKLARTPVADALETEWPHTLIQTSGEEVGLPPQTMGNSEVGHQNIGAGRIVDQEIIRITRSIREGSFQKNPALRKAFAHAFLRGSRLHLLGLVSDGQVHSDLEHLLALIDLAAHLNFPSDRLFIHAITDGRDTGPQTGLGYLRRVEESLKDRGVGHIASVSGRYYAMDRDHRWQRVARAYQCITGIETQHPLLAEEGGVLETARSAEETIQRYYDHPADTSRIGDEFIPPTQIIAPKDGRPLGAIKDSDAVIFFNFRGDRPRELTRAFMLDDQAWNGVSEGGFDRGRQLRDLFFCTMTSYEHGLPVSAIAFEKPPKMKNILGQVVSDSGLRQFRCAETEKFPHITFFFNDYLEEPFEGESRLLVPSPRDVTTYDQKPEMSAAEVCQGVLARLGADDCESLIVVNFANPDMVGHTGKLEAVIRAVETVDECVGRIVEATLARDGSLIVTADHGNAEQMWNSDHDCPHTAHTTHDVPLLVIGKSLQEVELRSGGRLSDIAPTLLAMMGLEQPEEMTGQSLIAGAEPSDTSS